MPVFKDQTRRTISIDAFPNRIISLVPSQTELLAHLDLTTEIIGITKFCVHPIDWFQNKKKVGGTKDLNIKAIQALQPHLIIANKEENVKEQIEALEKDFPVWVSDVNNLADAYNMISEIGNIVNKKMEAQQLISRIKNEFSTVPFHKLPTDNQNSLISTIYLIWQKPYMTVGGDTFINAMMEAAGFLNCFAAAKRYPKISIEEIKIKNPQLIILSSEPYPFKQKHIAELQYHLPETKIILADGEMFSWYGSRLLKAPEYFKTLHSLID